MDFNGYDVNKVQKPSKSLIGLDTYDILIMTNNKIMYDILKYEFKDYLNLNLKIQKWLNFWIFESFKVMLE